MALFAAVEPGSSRKLCFMFILVAIHAEGKLDLVARSLAGGNMAVCALDIGVWGHQREPGFGVVGHRVSGWAPTLHGVAALAPAPVGALEELASVRIGIMAIRAVCKGHGRFEIRGLMARKALHFEVFSQQGIFRF